MRSIPTLVLLGFSASLALAQRNITVRNTDPSIEYSGANIGDALVCKIDSNGNVEAGQPGCYNFSPQCTESVAIGRSPDSAATFTFRGSAIYINSGLYRFAPLYTVTLDGQSEDVDGFRENGPLSCEILFSRTGLDPTVDHTITLAAKGPSPNGNITGSAGPHFSLIDFTYTVEGEEDSGNSTAPTVNSSSPASSDRPTASSSTPAASSSEEPAADENAGSAISVSIYVALGSMLALMSTLL